MANSLMAMSPEERRRKACERTRKWNLLNKERARQTKHQWRLLHPEEHLERKRQSYQRTRENVRKRLRESDTPERRKANAKRSREWYRTNKDRRQTDEARQRACEATKRWMERHPEKKREYERTNSERLQARVRKRRAAQMGAEGSFTPEDIRHIYELQDGKCAGCRVAFEKTGAHRYHIDHIIPLQPANGGPPGSNNPENLQLLCRSCNCQKGNRTQEEWLRRRKLP